MEPYDTNESWSASTYYRTGLTQGKPKFNWKKTIYRISWVVLVGAVLGLLYVNWYEAQVIAKQRHLILEMYYFIKSGCPTEMLQ